MARRMFSGVVVALVLPLCLAAQEAATPMVDAIAPTAGATVAQAGGETAGPASGGADASEKAQTVEGAACAAPGAFTVSARYLQQVARCLHGDGAADRRRLALVEDIYIKAKSYAFLNKAAFWVSILLGVVVLAWPALVAILSPAPAVPAADGKAAEAKAAQTEADGAAASAGPGWLGFMRRPVAAAAVQTSLAALAALSFAFYAHYKESQKIAEAAMREVIFAEALDPELISRTLAAIGEMDRGFGFSDAPGLKPD